MIRGLTIDYLLYFQQEFIDHFLALVIMISFKKPLGTFSFNLSQEIKYLDRHKLHRGIPSPDSDKITIATWNIANLGRHERTENHLRLIAHMLSWFDIIAIQEVADKLDDLYRIESFIGSEFELLFNDRGGNDERAAFFYNGQIIDRLEMVGELAVPQSEHRHIKVDSVTHGFSGFDRNPFIASFQFKEFRFMLINAHIYFGSNSKENMDRRILETYAVGRYADLRRRDKHVFTPNIIALGDFNIPKAEKGDPVYNALAKRGLTIPQHSTQIWSNITSDKQYDQIAFFPSLKSKIEKHGVFDYDYALFPELYEKATRKQYEAYCRYYISDHRLMWLQSSV